ICRRMSALGEIPPVRLPLLGERPRALLLVGMAPHRDQLAGTGAAGVGQAQLEAAPESPLRAPHAWGRVAGDLLGERLRLVAESIGWVDDLADHPELVRPRRRQAL